MMYVNNIKNKTLDALDNNVFDFCFLININLHINQIINITTYPKYDFYDD